MRIILLLLLGLVSACAGNEAACRLDQVAELPVRLQGKVPVVTAEINGQPATLVVDTGSDATVLSRHAARRLGIPEAGPSRRIGAAGGQATVSPARLDTLHLGSLRLQVVRVLLADAPVPPLDGVLGLDVLNAYEMDLDVPQGRVALHRVRPCPTALPGWTKPSVALPTQMQAGSGHLFVSVTVDGEPLRGMLDSGASVSTLSIQAAEDVRINQKRLNRLPGARGQTLNTEGLLVRTQAFQSMQVGTDRLDRPLLSIADLPRFAGDLLVGSDYLSTRRVWFSFLLGRVFVEGQGP